jgi:hypothetical protein
LSVGKELSRLITAAVVNQEFCNLLLANPAVAVATGYNGEPFDLAMEEQELIISIRATSLADFAKQLTRNGHGNHNGNGYHQNLSRNGHSRSVYNGGFKEKACGHE